MFRLFYVSTARQGLSDDDIDLIVERAALRNRDLEITGAILFNGYNFGQILEGERNTVSDLMEEIKSDDRHNGVIVVAEREVENRVFPDWSMQRVEGLKFDKLFEAMGRP